MDVRLSRSALLRKAFGGVIGTSIASLAYGGTATASDECELVELYPGYPGYEGFVTGVDGAGDVACAEDLVEKDPSFDRDHEDSQNAKAARRLGLSGGPDTWTWENWMCIELERGLAPTCYSCAFSEADSRRAPQNASIERDDPRIKSGMLGTTSVIDTIGYPISHQLQGYFGDVDDYLFRALIWLIYGDDQLDARQVVQGYEDYFTWLSTSKGEVIDTAALWRKAVLKGGYFPVSDDALPDDQVFVMTIAVYTIVSPIGGVDQTLLTMYDNAVLEWQSDQMKSGPKQSLRDHLLSIGAQNWVV